MPSSSTTHPTATDGLWRVMRFENAEGKWAEVASNHVGPEAVPVPAGYKFVRSTPMVPCDTAAVGRARRVVRGLLGEFLGEDEEVDAIVRGVFMAATADEDEINTP